ncbi:hypothetical protein BT93_C0407 [Corymbia citriodora subsp. variegata]|nr:hypothetical protein BT93_C0407 [Corymbia citriodora subsp. variegata]
MWVGIEKSERFLITFRKKLRSMRPPETHFPSKKQNFVFDRFGSSSSSSRSPLLFVLSIRGRSAGVCMVRVDGSHPRTGNRPLRTGSKKLDPGTARWFHGSTREPDRRSGPRRSDEEVPRVGFLSPFDDDDLPLAIGGFSRSIDIKTARSTVGWPQKSAAHYNQLWTAPRNRTVCIYWLKGTCNQDPCGFLHDASRSCNVYHRAAKQSSHMPEDCLGKGPESSPVNLASSIPRKRGDPSKDKNPQKPREKVCRYWILGNCVKGDACPFLHLWFHGVDFAMLAKLEAHKKGISGIAIPSGSTKLFSGSKDGTVRIWDCHTGLCDQVINLGGEVGCFTCEGPWVFVGLPNIVKAWNIQNGASYDISGPVGQVHALEVANNMLFAGAQDGAILVCKEGSEADPFQMAAPLRGHTQGVVSLTIGRDRLYSGSIDLTIRVWDLNTLECVQELVGH